MGYRTLVMLYNDDQHNWQNDPELGNKIADGQMRQKPFPGGQVIAQDHADTQVIAVIDSYQYYPLAYSNWSRNEPHLDDVKLKMLRLAAEELGYKLVKA